MYRCQLELKRILLYGLYEWISAIASRFDLKNSPDSLGLRGCDHLTVKARRNVGVFHTRVDLQLYRQRGSHPLALFAV